MSCSADTLLMLQLEHRSILRLLAHLDVQCERIESGEYADVELLCLNMDYFRDYPDACHHPKEDLVFRRLQRVSPQAAARVGDLLGDHEAIDALTAETAEQVQRLRQDARTAPDVLPQLRRFIDGYRGHLMSEERHFFPAVARAFGRDDWDLVDFAIFDQQDPLFQESTEDRFRDLRKRIYRAIEEPAGPVG